MRYLLTITLACFFCINTSSAEETQFTAMFWNIHSGDSKATTIANNVAQKGAVDFWGLSEVPSDPAFLAAIEKKVEEATGIDYTVKMSKAGHSDRLAILFNSKRMTSEPYSGGTDGLVDLGDNFFEVKSVNSSGTVRPSLGVQLNDGKGQSVVVLVNHWKAKGDDRSRGIRIAQAEATNTFVARTPGLPVVIAGDHNIPIKHASDRQQKAFHTLDRVFDYLKPNNSDVGSFRSGSVLDSVFVANDHPDWDSETAILNRVGNRLATKSTFVDNRFTSDHRPLRLVLTSDTDSRIEALEEELRAAEALVDRLKARLDVLKGEGAGDGG